MFRISSCDKSDCPGISGELGGIALIFSASEIGFSYSHSHALANMSSCLRLTSGSSFHSCGVIRIPAGGWRGELTHLHAMKHLRLVGANFAYQMSAVR